MKNLLIIPLLLLTTLLPAQNKQRDPQWLMPLYFRDANGDRDTVYFGYDPEASMYDDADTVLGENWIIIDTSKFNIFLIQYPNCFGGDCPLNTDTVKKIDVRNYSVGAQLGFCKGKLPISMKWVDSLLYTPTCPFPDLSPRPRARIDLTCNHYEWEYFSCNNPDDYPLSLTDYPAPEIHYPITDSMVFNGSGLYSPSEVITDVALFLVAHDRVYVGLENEKKDILNLYPNPFCNELNIENTQADILSVQILSPIGQVLFQEQKSGANMTLNLEFLNKGLYILVLYTEHYVYVKKILKVE